MGYINKVLIVLVVIVVAIFAWSSFHDTKQAAPPSTSGITYINATTDNIVVDQPLPEGITGKDFSITGKARGPWFFEGSFPVEVLDGDGNVLFNGPAEGQGNWMTGDFVTFYIEVKIPTSFVGKAAIVLKKDNSSGLPKNDASISFPITVEH